MPRESTSPQSPAAPAGGSRRRALRAAVALALGASAGGALVPASALAALPDGTVLAFEAGQDTDGDGFADSGSWFAMDTNGDLSWGPSERTAIEPGPDGGVILGQHQPSADATPHPEHIDRRWNFFFNTGVHNTVTVRGDPAPAHAAIDASGDELIDMTSWAVDWSTTYDIDMGGDPANFGTQDLDGDGDAAGGGDLNSGLAKINCTDSSGNPKACAVGDSFTLDYHAQVPKGSASGFGAVPYELHLEGTLQQAGLKDDTVDDVVSGDGGGGRLAIAVLDNDIPPPSGFDPTTLQITGAPAGTATDDDDDGVVEYAPPDNFAGGVDSFGYSITDNNGNPVAGAPTVTINEDPSGNTAPTCAADNESVTRGQTKNVAVLGNDTDPNPNAGIDPTSVIATANRGTVVNVNSDGTLDYRPPASGSSDTVTYTVSDSLGMPCSPAGTVDIGITDIFNHAPTSWNGDDITAVLAYEAGIPDPSGDKSDKPQSGSFFSMEMQPGEFIYTVLEPGTAGGLVIGQEMASETSHSGAPTGKEVAAFDQGWNFFGNTGMHFTRKGGIRVEESDPAFNNTLLFRDRWFVTWNGIEAINQGGCVIGGTPPCSDFVKEDDPGHASLECSSEPCEDGSSFELTYSAHVPHGDPSGFGGVPYTLSLTGTVIVVDSSAQTSAGTIGPGSTGSMRVDRDELPDDPGALVSCFGQCYDFQVTGVSGSVSVVLPIPQGIPEDAIYRKLVNGSWQDFDDGGADSVASAGLVSGSGMRQCPAPNDAAYTPGLTAGHRCVRLTIADGGPNDADGASDGTVMDPGGVAVAVGGGAGATADLSTGTGGCSMSRTPMSAWERGDWWLMAVLLGGLGLAVRRRRVRP